MNTNQKLAMILATSLAFLGAAVAHTEVASPKPATAATRAANQQVQTSLPFNDKSDFEDAQRGFMGAPETLTIKNAAGAVVWDLESYKKFIGLDKAAPDSVNPSLWRNAQLNMQYGLFKVTDRIYQVRGFDLSNITFVQGDTGWIVFDPLISAETAKAAYDFVTRSSASALFSPSSTAIRTPITTAACAASSMRLMSRPARSRSSLPSTSPSTPSAKT